MQISDWETLRGDTLLVICRDFEQILHLFNVMKDMQAFQISILLSVYYDLQAIRLQTYTGSLLVLQETVCKRTKVFDVYDNDLPH